MPTTEVPVPEQERRAEGGRARGREGRGAAAATATAAAAGGGGGGERRVECGLQLSPSLLPPSSLPPRGQHWAGSGPVASWRVGRGDLFINLEYTQVFLGWLFAAPRPLGTRSLLYPLRGRGKRGSGHATGGAAGREVAPGRGGRDHAAGKGLGPLHRVQWKATQFVIIIILLW
eukprot:SM000002S05558  [mRNA]  locus=s2:818138:818858:+ [translate_table: standard]